MQQNKQKDMAEASGSRTSGGADSTQDQQHANALNAPNAPNSASVVHGVPALGIDQAPKDGRYVLVFGDVEGLQGAEGPAWIKAAWRKDYPAGEPYWQWGAPGYTGMVRNASHWYPLPCHPDAPATDYTAALTAERNYFRAAYERKLNEHSVTLDDAQQLCAERDALTAHVAALRAALAPFAEPENWSNEDDQWFFGNDEGWPLVGDPYEAPAAALAATPEQSLAALREKTVLHFVRGIVQGCEGLGNPEAERLMREHVERVRNEAAAEVLAELTDRAIVGWLDTSRPPRELMAALLEQTRTEALDPRVSERAEKLRNEAAAEALERLAEDQDKRGWHRLKQASDAFAEGSGAARMNVADSLREEAQRLREAART